MLFTRERDRIADRQVKIELINQTIGNLFMRKVGGLIGQKTTFGIELVLQLLVAENHGQKLITSLLYG